MDNTVWLFVGFGVFVVCMLVLDLGVFHRNSHEVSLREAGLWYAAWVLWASVFAVGVFVWLGSDKGLKFLTGYAIELTLSTDNIFVFLAIFSDFALPAQYRHRALFYGILGALILRAVLIATGVTLINLFQWVVYPLGAFLIFTGVRLAWQGHHESRPGANPIVKFARRFLPVTDDYVEERFFVRRSGVLMATPLFLVVLVIAINDVAFALDSVPAVLSITKDPFIVYSSNVFAVLGLRALFFLVSGALRRLTYLSLGLTVILSFVGVKLILSPHIQIPTLASLAVVVTVLAVTIVASKLKPSRLTETWPDTEADTKPLV